MIWKLCAFENMDMIAGEGGWWEDESRKAGRWTFVEQPSRMSAGELSRF
jgi:hypothetical protein